MRNLFRFIKIYHFVLLFILMESFSLFLYLSNHKFQQSKFLSFTQEYTGAIFNYYSDLTQYLNLNEENESMHRENAKLYTLLNNESKNQELLSGYIPLLRQDLKNLENEYKSLVLEYKEICIKERFTDPPEFGEWLYEKKDMKTLQIFDYIPARVIKNSIFKQNNFIMLDKGEKDGVKSGMGVRVNNGVIGIVFATSENFSKVTSILNQNATIHVVHVKSEQHGSLRWNTNDYMTATMEDLPNSARDTIQIGDTIQTSGRSAIFPEGINIAKVISYNKGNKSGFFNLNIKFLNDMNTVKNVYIINSLMKEEIENLEEPEIYLK